MNYKELFKNENNEYANKELIIVGVNPIVDELTTDVESISDLMRTNENLCITIIYESETENFNQSMTCSPYKRAIELNKLKSKRERLIGGKKAESKKGYAGLMEDVFKKCLNDKERSSFKKRFLMFQNNLRHNINLIKSDNRIWYCVTVLDTPKCEMYQSVDKLSDERLYNLYNDYIAFLLNSEGGSIFLSSPGDELIQLYDLENIPRGIYPRKAFYTTDYQRYSVWVFIFNRKGELLLQKRSDYTADNRSLWDKSAGGHVDIDDSSTILTAKRELVEELFMPNAEYTKYMKDKIDDLIDFGEWNIQKRPEKLFKDNFESLDEEDWVVFRATDKITGEPLTIKRESERKMHFKKKDANGAVVKDDQGHAVFEDRFELWYTKFISDVYMFIAPQDCIDTEEQMNKIFADAEKKGAASMHKLIGIEELFQDISQNRNHYTDDMVYVNKELKWLLVQFSEFIKYIF